MRILRLKPDDVIISPAFAVIAGTVSSQGETLTFTFFFVLWRERDNRSWLDGFYRAVSGIGTDSRFIGYLCLKEMKICIVRFLSSPLSFGIVWNICCFLVQKSNARGTREAPFWLLCTFTAYQIMIKLSLLSPKFEKYPCFSKRPQYSLRHSSPPLHPPQLETCSSGLVWSASSLQRDPHWRAVLK